jgi:hypothetical protein
MKKEPFIHQATKRCFVQQTNESSSIVPLEHSETTPTGSQAVEKALER